MTEPDPNRRSSSSSWAIYTAIAIVVYFLSPGIFVWAQMFGPRMSPTTNQVYGTIYAPISFLGEHVPGVHSFYRWYFRALGAPIEG